ncbi:MAG TPA: type I DNA topoisomerase, partial [Burkholderiales bacterium]|nr:type I DNA topoisomerase [Burkholderiales bacterium]
KLLIVESPSKAKTLKKYLGKGYEILASYGHVRDLVPKTGAVDPDDDFRMDYELIARNSKHVDSIAKAVKEADNILLATDPDREGEAIAWHLAEILKSKRLLKNKELKRVVFYEITQSAVKDAVERPRDISMPLVNAQQARRALDYLVGFNLSPVLWKKIRRGLSAGRVQSPALRLIVEREIEIENFKSQEYWSLHLDTHKGAQPFTAKLAQFKGEKLTQFTVTNEAQQKEIVDFLAKNAKGEAQVESIEKKRKQRFPAAPFTTSTLQQEAVRKLGFSTDRTMKVAQQLYEGMDTGSGAVGLITYMRTDSVSLSNEALGDIRTYIGKQYGKDYLPGKAVEYVNKSKNAQEAHEAIRPTSIDRTPESLRAYLGDDHFRLYEMIWKRTMASQMTPAQFDTVAVDLAVGGKANLFRANGQTMVFPGFYAVYHESVDDAEEERDSKLPALEEGEKLPVDKLYGEQHFTQPPPRYTEASLVKTLEEYGIGRPSTYSSIIHTLLAREYAILDKKRFTPTDVGRVVNKFLTEHFNQWIDYDFTAKLEDQLDDISNGKTEWKPVLANFWKDFSKQVEEKSQASVARPTTELIDEYCPKCTKQLTRKLGKRGFFIGCSGYPECDFTRNEEGAANDGASGPVPVGTFTDGQEMILLQGPYGPYVQLGQAGEDGKKPKRVSLPKGLTPETITPEIAAKLLSLPRDLGPHPESGKKVTVSIGRFGPYIQHDGGFKSIPRTDNVLDIELPRAVELLAQPKGAGRSAPAGKPIGNHPADGEVVSVHDGRYGPYVKHGAVNATIPPTLDAATITLDDAIALIEAKAAKGPPVKKTPAKKSAAKKTSATTEIAAAKKTLAKKSTTAAKKTTAKKTTSGKTKKAA